MKQLRGAVILSVIAVILGGVAVVLWPHDSLKVLNPYVLSDQAVFFTGGPPGQVERMRTIDLQGVTPFEVRDILLNQFPKGSGWDWSGSSGEFYQVGKGFYQVSVTPAPIGATPGATVQVREWCPLDARTLIGERLRHGGRLPLQKLSP